MKGIYESAETLIYDPVAANRNATRASLHSLGFRKVELAPSIEALTKHLRQAAPDLLFTEVSGSDVDIFPLIQSVRQGELGENPFTVVIATTWRRDGTLVNKVLNSGADDLVARPISTATLGDRIRLHVERRKGFVVTSTYIGPDRRRDLSRPGADCVEVPNSLKVRTLEGLPEDEADRRIAYAIARGKKSMNAQKVRRDAVQLCIQWRLLEQRSQATTDFVDNLSRLEKIAREIKRRLSKTDDMAASDLCMAIESSVAMIVHMQSGAGANSEALDFRPILHRLGMAALGLGRIFAPAETDPESLAERVTLASRNHVQAA